MGKNWRIEKEEKGSEDKEGENRKKGKRKESRENEWSRKERDRGERTWCGVFRLKEDGGGACSHEQTQTKSGGFN